MNAERFRALALDLPEVEEGAHQGHPDFRVGGKVFATLGPDRTWAMVKLPPAEQSLAVAAEPEVFEPFAGAWGKQGCTRVALAAARVSAVRDALRAAWGRTAPKRLTDPAG